LGNLKIVRKYVFYCLVFIITSCQKELSKESVAGYDIFLIAGQSNTSAGYSIDPISNTGDYRILQLARYGIDSGKFIRAIEPLQHTTVNVQCIGFATTFATLYANTYLAPNRRVVLIPCGANNSGFINNCWNRANNNYLDAVNRVNKILTDSASATFKGILWHQGEQDINFGLYYKQLLDNLIDNFREDIITPNNNTFPIIAGGFVPFWVNQNSNAKRLDSIIKTLPLRKIFTGFANPTVPSIISKINDTIEAIHFDAAGQIELGKRYFEQYQLLSK
jgi:hypothetical protein